MSDDVSTTNNALSAEVKQAMERHGLTQVDVSRESGVPKSRFNLWLSGRYTGNIGEIESKIKVWLNACREREEAAPNMPVPPPWVRTPTAKRIEAMLSFVQMFADMGVVYGAAGAGKTHACRHYAQGNPNVWVSTMTGATGSLAACLEQIAIDLDMLAFLGRSSRLERAIVDRLRGTRGLLIIDEAQHLSRAALEEIRSIFDASGIGVVLSGNEAVYSQLTGGSRAAGFAQLYSRIGRRVKLNGLPHADLEHLAGAWGLTDNKTITRLYKYCDRQGGLRHATKILIWGTMLAKAQSEDLGIDHIRTAWGELGAVQ